MEGEKEFPVWGRHVSGELFENWPRDREGLPEKPVFLCHCRGLDMDDTMLVSRMESYGIPCLRQYPSNGDFGRLIMGVSGAGVDIYVPAAAWADACELLGEEEEEPEEDE